MARVSLPEPIMPDDYFEVLGLARRAALAEDEVRDAFQVGSKVAHPDSGGDPVEFERINRAHTCLGDPVARLKHLAELQFGGEPSSSGDVDAVTMSLFETVAAALSEADAFLKRHAGASSAIARALLAKDEASAAASAFTASGAVRARRAEVLQQLPAIDSALAAGHLDQARAAVGECCRALAFLGKWEAQLAERMAALAAA